MEGRYSFTQQDWDDVSDDSKDLVSFFFNINFNVFYFNIFYFKIKNLLVVDPTSRFTAEEALNSQFFKKEVELFQI